MEREKLESLLIDYIDGTLQGADLALVQRELSENPESIKLYEQLKIVLGTIDRTREWEPGLRMKSQFDKNLQNEMLEATPTHGKQVFFRPVFFRAAAVIALVVSGGAIGLWISRSLQRDTELEALKREMQATKQMLMTQLGNRESASQRMMGVTVAYAMEKPDDQIVKALAKAMNDDPNTNVRLAALEALGKFRQEEQVRQVLISSLSTQKDPIVQIALIQLMVKMKEKDVVKKLQDITDDATAIPAVRDEAHVGILKLS